MPNLYYQISKKRHALQLRASPFLGPFQDLVCIYISLFSLFHNLNLEKGWLNVAEVVNFLFKFVKVLLKDLSLTDIFKTNVSIMIE